MPDVQPNFKTFTPPKKGRSRVNPVSEKRRSQWPRRTTERERILERDGGCLLAHHNRCFGTDTVHHRRKEGQGGAYDDTNLICLCSGCNCLLEADADFADWGQRHGVVLKAGDDPAFMLVGCPLTCEIDHRPAPSHALGDPE